MIEKCRLIEELVISNRETKQTRTWTEQELFNKLLTYNKDTSYMITLNKRQLREACFPPYREAVRTQLIPFLQSVLRQPYVSNGTVDGPFPSRNGAHEKRTVALLRRYNLTFVRIPNGKKKAPDFRVYLTLSKFLDLELKSRERGNPLFNSTAPTTGVVYIFCSKKHDQTTIFFGQDVVTNEYHELYAVYKLELMQFVKDFVEQNN